MNPVQFAQQIKHRLQNAVWPEDILTGDAGSKVFGTTGGVAVFAGAPTDEQMPPGFPWALIGMDGAEYDQDHPDYVTARFSVVVGAIGMGDRMGEMAIIGGGIGSSGRSANRGVGATAAIARSYVETMTGADGAHVILSGSSMSAPAQIGPGKHLCMERFDLTALCTTQPQFASPQRLRYANTKWLWEGGQCSSRFDFQQFYLVYKTGANPSADIYDGTVVYNGTAAEWTGNRISGKTYTCFAAYTSRGNGAEDFSPVVVGSYRVPA